MIDIGHFIFHIKLHGAFALMKFPKNFIACLPIKVMHRPIYMQ